MDPRELIDRRAPPRDKLAAIAALQSSGIFCCNLYPLVAFLSLDQGHFCENTRKEHQNARKVVE